MILARIISDEETAPTATDVIERIFRFTQSTLVLLSPREETPIDGYSEKSELLRAYSTGPIKAASHSSLRIRSVFTPALSKKSPAAAGLSGML